MVGVTLEDQVRAQTGPSVTWLGAGLAAVTVAVAALSHPRHVGALHVVALAITGVWAAAGVVGVTRKPAQVPGLIVLGGCAAAAVALAGGTATDVAAPFVAAVSLHLLLALPTGRLEGRLRRAVTGAGYAGAAVAAAAGGV